VIDELRNFAHSKFLLAQRVKRYVSGPEFERAYQFAKDEDRKKFKGWIETLDLTPLRRRVQELLMEDLDSLSYKNLRELGKRHHIKHWHLLDKETLLWEVRNARDAAEKHRRALRDNEDSDPKSGNPAESIRLNPSKGESDEGPTRVSR
jgi:hypothetical protein